ncbi:MAG: hypothetical protein A2V52_05230 [Actinobacteria bacterium RBG_19FT_COMBO_54_7]|uniref:Uncharacterized protein n=1 Tax=Candidatus Solincola sediminis TaxID=1797199 RepID=A0A1F2WI36_9ACTN|nr:MAG: hypothetical protein A2Y75_01055 [Candidatus Solincola sediminis]OFW58052.1 MAG: hypothetical protein A2W01_06175 [Candidatus Solincola sediminis]OFW67096.1 MAG: hypothetical protein A2V52_05230 [Actinobacteria bacterium RBG_19FT_COMBO_54_7]
MGVLSEGPVSFPEFASRLFKNPLVALFPGPQILHCHLDKLESDGRVRCRGEEYGWRLKCCRERRRDKDIKMIIIRRDRRKRDLYAIIW